MVVIIKFILVMFTTMTVTITASNKGENLWLNL